MPLGTAVAPVSPTKNLKLHKTEKTKSKDNTSHAARMQPNDLGLRLAAGAKPKLIYFTLSQSPKWNEMVAAQDCGPTLYH